MVSYLRDKWRKQEVAQKIKDEFVVISAIGVLLVFLGCIVIVAYLFLKSFFV